MRRLLVSSLLAGVACGVVGAIAIPETRTRAASGASTTPAPTSSPRVLRIGKPLPVPRAGGYVHLHRTGPFQIAARVNDPRGGPDWVVRVFMAERRVARSDQRAGVSPIIGFNRCAQLGRIHRGRFGWLTADGTFRPVGAQLVRIPATCGSRTPDLRGQPFADVLSTITDPRNVDARIVQTIVWGIAGPAASDAVLQVAGRSRALPLGRAGAMLSVLPANVHADQVRLAVQYPRRGRVSALPARQPALPFASSPATRARRELVATAPDPDGGLPFAMAVSTAGSTWCVETAGRVVGGNRIGGPDYDLDLLRESAYSHGASCGRRNVPRDRRTPPFRMVSSYGGGAGVELGEDPSPGRIARRSPRGRMIFAGTADPDVTMLTFASPRDVRTVVPTGRARAFLLVYAGTFPTGEMVITTTFRDGRTRRDTLPSGI